MRYTAFILCILLLNNALASQQNDSFLLSIESISLNRLNKKDRYSFCYSENLYNNSEYLKERKVYYYPELVRLINSELKKHDFIMCDDQNPPNYKIAPWYSGEQHYIKFREFVFGLDAVDFIELSPVWQIKATTKPDNSFNIRITIPSLIKCISPYFNKNFKGTITCKR